MVEFFSEVGDAVTNVIGDGIGGVIQTVLYNTIYRLMYYIVVGICWVLQLLYEMLEVFSGLVKISYNSKSQYLIEVFFGNSAVTNAYWGMALIGVLCTIAFTVFAISKKMFDLSGKDGNSLGAIIGNLCKSILIILSLSSIMVITLSATNTMFEAVNKLFVAVQQPAGEKTITFDDEQYATMARVLNTIGNYSLSPASSSRYNINSCFNDIRNDMNILMKQGVFNYNYDLFKVRVKDEVDEDGTPVTVIQQFLSWQRSLKAIANAANLTEDLKMDAYNESVSTAIVDVMNEMKKNPSFKPLSKYERIYAPSQRIPMDRLLFLLGTLRGANNEDYNKEPSLTDSVRGAYYTGTKDMYDYDTVTADFDIGIGGFDYVVVIAGALALAWSFINMIITFIQRIFFMLTLYIIAPPAIATMPMDNGDKFKKWTSSFVVQCLSVFGTLITMHLFLLFMPIIFDPKLVLFENILLNLIGKLMLLVGGSFACRSANTLITSLLSGDAGQASASLADNNGSASAGMSMAGQGAKVAGGLAWAGTKMAVKGGAMATAAGATGVYQGFKGARNFMKNEMPQKMQRAYKIASREWKGIKEMAGDVKNQFFGPSSSSGKGSASSGSSGGGASQMPSQAARNDGPSQTMGQSAYSMQGQGSAQGQEQIPTQNSSRNQDFQPQSQSQNSFQPQSQSQSSFQPQSQSQSSFQPQSQSQSSFQPQSQSQTSFQPQSQSQSSFQPQSQSQSSFQPQSQSQTSFQPSSQGSTSFSGGGTQPSSTTNTPSQPSSMGYSSSSLGIGSGGSVSINKPLPPSNFKKS